MENRSICQSALAITRWAGILTQVSGLQGPSSYQYSTLCPKTEHWDPRDLELFEHWDQPRPESPRNSILAEGNNFFFPSPCKGPHTLRLDQSTKIWGNFSDALWAETRSSWGCLPRPANLGHLLLLALQRLSGKMITALTCLSIYLATWYLEENKEIKWTLHSPSFNYRNSQDQLGSY